MVKLDTLIRRPKHKVILFADISGSSALYKTQGNVKAKQIVDSLLESIKKLVIEFRGNVIKTIGDEVMVCFNDGEKCLNSSVAMQQRFNSVLQQHGLMLSIGISFGEVLTDNGDIFGEAVNDAAYLTELAKGGQILLAESVLSQLSSQTKTMVREYDRVKLKGADVDSLIYRVYWLAGQSLESETRLMSGKIVREELNFSSLVIRYGQQEYAIDQTQIPFVFGRDANKCDLLVDASQVSREHCHIDFRRGKFVLIDHSTNGCYIKPQGKDEFYIRNQEYPLIESVQLSLGISAELSDTAAISLMI